MSVFKAHTVRILHVTPLNVLTTIQVQNKSVLSLFLKVALSLHIIFIIRSTEYHNMYYNYMGTNS